MRRILLVTLVSAMFGLLSLAGCCDKCHRCGKACRCGTATVQEAPMPVEAVPAK